MNNENYEKINSSDQLPQSNEDAFYDQYKLADNSMNFKKQNNIPFYKKKVFLIISILTLFVLAGVMGVFSYYGSSSDESRLSPLAKRLNDSLDVDPLAPKDIANPLTGVQYTKPEAQDWLGTRPLGVMINNHLDARPQSGLIYADVVYEVVAEGGITRFLAFFLSNTPEKIGPIRSTREYYLVLVKEMGDAMLMHEGYSPQALAAIESWPVRSLQRGGASGLFNWRDNPRNVATEHTLYSNGVELKNYGNERLGWSGHDEGFESWKFREEVKPQPSADVCLVGDCKPIVVDFWFEGDYSAIWKYDKDSNSYLRFTGYDDNGEPVPHVDWDTKEQIKVKNLIVQFAQESAIEGDDKSRLEYELVGSGEGLVFMDGGVTNVTWSKASRDGRTKFYDENGSEMEFNRGNFWISLVPERNKDQVSF